MDNLIQNRTRPGLKEYESRIYAALIGIGEGNARQIHEASGVPRPRVYDIAEGLAKKGLTLLRTLTIFCSINIVKTENYSFIYLPG